MTVRGTADVTLTAWLLADADGGRSGAEHVVRRFGCTARIQGTLVVAGVSWATAPDPEEPEMEPPVHVVAVRYRHTCRNRYNHKHDGRRFLTSALRVGRDDEWAGDVIEVTLHSWQASEQN